MKTTEFNADTETNTFMFYIKLLPDIGEIRFSQFSNAPPASNAKLNFPTEVVLYFKM